MVPVKYSFILAAYNEESNISEIYRRLADILSGLDGNSEIIFVDDGSRDQTLNIIKALRQKDKRVCFVSLARNFGHQVAISAGFKYARGNAIFVMDADLQDPPELIPEMVGEWQKGYKIVYAKRARRKGESFIKKFFAYVFYRLLRKLTQMDIPVDSGDFCLLDRCIVDVINSMPERHRYLRGMRAWIGYRKKAVTFERPARYSGKAKYTCSKSLALAIDSIISFTRIPLQLATFIGLASAGIAFISTLLILYWRIFIPGTKLTGITMIIITFFFIGGVQLICLGIIGEYIGRIYEESQKRPLYTISQAEGFD